MEAKEKKAPEQSKSLAEFLKTNKRFAIFLVGVMLLFHTHMLASNYLYQIIESVGGNSSHLGVASSLAAAVEIPGMILFAKIVEKISCQKLIRIAGMVYAVKFLCFYMADSVTMVYVAQMFQIGSYAIFIPASVYYVSHLFGKADTVKGQSLVTTAITLGTVIASLDGGWIMDHFGVREMLLVAMVIAWIGIALIFAGLEKKFLDEP